MVLDSGYLHADETIIKVLDSDKKEATHQGYYWVYQCHEQRLVLFDYRPGRGVEGPRSVLKNYQGYLQTDGYGVYEEIGNQRAVQSKLEPGSYLDYRQIKSTVVQHHHLMDHSQF